MIYSWKPTTPMPDDSIIKLYNIYYDITGDRTVQEWEE